MSSNVALDSTFAPDESRAGLYVKPEFDPHNVIVRDAQGKILYAVVGLFYNAKGRPEYEGPSYYSASDQASAEFQFKRRFWHRNFSLVFAGPAIGFFVHDNHGDVLSAGGERPEARSGALGESDREHG